MSVLPQLRIHADAGDLLAGTAGAEIQCLRMVLAAVSLLIKGYVDADHNGTSFIPNDAMRAQQLIAEVLTAGAMRTSPNPTKDSQ